jgi:hypothetical protein
MSRSTLLSILGTGAMFLGSLTLGGCPQTGDSSATADVADESSNSVLPGSNASAQDAADANGQVTPQPSDNTNPPDITDPGNNASGIVGDFDGDSVLTDADIKILSKSFGSNLPGGDLNADNRIDILDLALLLSLVE